MLLIVYLQCQKQRFIINNMENKYIIGNTYTLKEIHDDGFVNIKVTSIAMFYRKAKTIMNFSITKQRKTKRYKLISIGENE